MKLGIFGCGFSGRTIGQRMSESGHSVWGTTRSEANFSRLCKYGIEPAIFDGATITDILRKQLVETTHLVISIAPPRDDNALEPDAPVDPVLIALEGMLLKDMAPALQWVGYLSTVGVYGDHGGDWVDETTATKPGSARTRQRVKAEAEWLQAGKTCGVPVAVFRLSGIYGPGRNGLLNAFQGKSRRLVKKDQVFNRVHVDDIAKAVQRAAEKNIGGLFNITDDKPAPPQDVVAFAHAVLGTTPPPETDFETAELSPMARSFYGENKRVSNARSKSVLGLHYTWPDYRTALRRMYDDGNWKG